MRKTEGLLFLQKRRRPKLNTPKPNFDYVLPRVSHSVSKLLCEKAVALERGQLPLDCRLHAQSPSFKTLQEHKTQINRYLGVFRVIDRHSSTGALAAHKYFNSLNGIMDSKDSLIREEDQSLTLNMAPSVSQHQDLNQPSVLSVEEVSSVNRHPSVLNLKETAKKIDMIKKSMNVAVVDENIAVDEKKSFVHNQKFKLHMQDKYYEQVQQFKQFKKMSSIRVSSTVQSHSLSDISEIHTGEPSNRLSEKKFVQANQNHLKKKSLFMLTGKKQGDQQAVEGEIQKIMSLNKSKLKNYSKDNNNYNSLPLPSIEQTKKFLAQRQWQPNPQVWNFTVKDVASENIFRKPKMSGQSYKQQQLECEKNLREKFKMRLKFEGKYASMSFPGVTQTESAKKERVFKKIAIVQPSDQNKPQHLNTQSLLGQRYNYRQTTTFNQLKLELERLTN